MERFVAFFTGRNDYPPAVRTFLREYGDLKIAEMYVCRTPIQQAIDLTLNVISLGQWRKNKNELDYDNLYHLFLYIKLLNENTENSFPIKLEKNHVITCDYTDDMGKENMKVPFQSSIPLKTFMENGKNFQNSGQLGPNYGKDFYAYNPSNNNCQVFITALLRGNNINIPELETFVLQNADKILTGHTRTIASAVTNLASRFDILLHGKGKRHYVFKTIKKKKYFIRNYYKR